MAKNKTEGGSSDTNSSAPDALHNWNIPAEPIDAGDHPSNNMVYRKSNLYSEIGGQLPAFDPKNPSQVHQGYSNYYGPR